jgi:DNA ligase-associated metallophosphoesterase
MNSYPISVARHALLALPSGGLWWPDAGLLCVSDLHLGKSGRMARRAGLLLPPYDTLETLARLSKDIEATKPQKVVCLGDSFDDLQAARTLSANEDALLHQLIDGRDWIWIEGNHDPAPTHLGGRHQAVFIQDSLTFRHIADEEAQTEVHAEISGHFHPKARLATRGRGISRPCFVTDGQRLIMPAYGTYIGGLSCEDPALRKLFKTPAIAILTGDTMVAVPLSPNAMPITKMPITKMPITKMPVTKMPVTKMPVTKIAVTKPRSKPT